LLGAVVVHGRPDHPRSWHGCADCDVRGTVRYPRAASFPC
jgi:hypothetical protein